MEVLTWTFVAASPDDDKILTMYERVARLVANDWNASGNCALVVGATFPNEIARVRHIVGDMPLLVPGIGAQGGDIVATVTAGKTGGGKAEDRVR